MKAAVIYQSHYGSTQTYAQWIAEDLGADLLVASQVKPTDLQRYDTLVYGGGLYAGGVNGIALLTKNTALLGEKALYLFTVGASDPTDPENIKAIRSGLEQKLPPALFAKLHLYHLRGGMYFSKMGFFHRTAMKMMTKMLRNKPESELRSDERSLLQSLKQDTDFTDRATIAPLVEEVLHTA